MAAPCLLPPIHHLPEEGDDRVPQGRCWDLPQGQEERGVNLHLGNILRQFVIYYSIIHIQ